MDKSDTDERTERQREIQTYRLEWDLLGSSGPQCGYKVLFVSRWIHFPLSTDIDTNVHIIFISYEVSEIWQPYIHKINASWRWTPILEINENTKIIKYPWMTGRTDGHIILPIRIFHHMACGCMRCVQFWDARMIAKKWHMLPDRDTERQIEGEMDKETDIHISSTGTHWGLMRSYTSSILCNINLSLVCLSQEAV